MNRRAFILALAAIASVAICIVMLGWQRLSHAADLRRQADAQWRSLQQRLLERERLRADLGFGQMQRRDQEDVVQRVRSSLQDLGISAARLQGVRPREERVVQDGAALRQSVLIELRGLSPADIGAWLQHWCTAENPWRLTGMRWRHSSGAQGNVYDCSISCTAVLLQ